MASMSPPCPGLTLVSYPLVAVTFPGGFLWELLVTQSSGQSPVLGPPGSPTFLTPCPSWLAPEQPAPCSRALHSPSHAPPILIPPIPSGPGQACLVPGPLLLGPKQWRASHSPLADIYCVPTGAECSSSPQDGKELAGPAPMEFIF